MPSSKNRDHSLPSSKQTSDPIPYGTILSVEEGSPAHLSGIRSGYRMYQVDGHPLRDVLDWLWFTSEDSIEVDYEDLIGERHTSILHRDEFEDWGIAFTDIIFDSVKTCRNNCGFCFMAQMPKGLRDPLILRDDDYRMSFLNGTFITLTNLSDLDIERIIEQNISPLNVSLHCADPDIRESLIGRYARSGIENLEKLVEAGIRFNGQIVLVPGVNDDEVLDETLEYAYSLNNIDSIGIVPLGFTRFQNRFDHSFGNPKDALKIIEQLRPFQERALEERGAPWVFAADEFYCNAYGDALLEHLPEADFYDSFPMFEDGIGIVRSCVDSFLEAMEAGDTDRLADFLEKNDGYVVYICGKCMETYADELLSISPLKDRFRFLYIDNGFFGGNVNVTGLLSGSDIVNGILSDSVRLAADRLNLDKVIYVIPDIVFNSDRITIDDMDVGMIADLCNARLHVCSSNPLEYIPQIETIVKERR